jgi:hypothetical protein
VGSSPTATARNPGRLLVEPIDDLSPQRQQHLQPLVLLLLKTRRCILATTLRGAALTTTTNNQGRRNETGQCGIRERAQVLGVQQEQPLYVRTCALLPTPRYPCSVRLCAFTLLWPYLVGVMLPSTHAARLPVPGASKETSGLWCAALAMVPSPSLTLALITMNPSEGPRRIASCSSAGRRQRPPMLNVAATC